MNGTAGHGYSHLIGQGKSSNANFNGRAIEEYERLLGDQANVKKQDKDNGE